MERNFRERTLSGDGDFPEIFLCQANLPAFLYEHHFLLLSPGLINFV